MLMHKVKRTRTWDNVTLSEIAAKIAGEYGSQLGVPNGHDPGNIKIEADLDKKVAHRHQASQTDAEFLSRLARRYGLEFYVDSRGLHFKRRNMQQAPVTSFTWYSGEGTFLDFDVENDITRKAGAVTLKGFDPLSKKPLSHRADNDSTKRHGLAPVIEIIDKRTGQASLQARHAEEHTGHTTEISAAAVKAQASGLYQQHQQTTVKLTFTVIGDPDVSAKRVIEFKGLGKRLSGRYYVNEVTHSIDGTGYLVKGKAHKAGHGGYNQNNVASKAALNSKGVGKKPEQIEIVDRRTGETSIQFKHSGSEPHT
jgi:phage protein D